MPVPPTEVTIDLGRDALLAPHALETLQDRYLVADETSPQQAFARAAAAFADDAAHAQRLYDYASKGYFMFATPLLSNGGTERGLPISCYLNYMADSRKGINGHYEETSWLSSLGGGVGGFVGVRGPEGTSKGSASSGSIPFVAVIDRYMLAFSQGKTRRGSYASYMDISHPEIDEFLELRKASGGDANRKALNLHHAVCITDDFMEACIADADWNLVSPKTGKIKKTVNARALMRKIVETRHQTGEPFILFKDTANRALPEPLKRKGYKINHSNLCTEIMLPTAEDRTAVCCLSSTNLAAYDEWKDDPLFIEDLMRMLDNTLDVFIEKAPIRNCGAPSRRRRPSGRSGSEQWACTPTCRITASRGAAISPAPTT
jgi:ribonucleoside-diphosphate reductase alpha chain